MRNLTLLTDLYQLTMGQGYFNEGKHEQRAVFDVFFRPNRLITYSVAAGMEQAAQYLENLHFDESDIAYLRSLEMFSEEYLSYLAKLRFTGDVRAVREGEIVFPYEPIVTVSAPMLEAQLVETALLTFINHQTLIASKAAKICAAAGGGVMEFGLRRAQGADAGVYGARAAMIGGCVGTSNVYAGKLFHVPVSGTMAHSWVMNFPSEVEAFRAYAECFPDNCLLLVDTYDTLRSGVPNAITVFRELREKGYEPKGIRLDSGDLAYLSKKAREMLDEAGFENAIICASGDLDETLIRSLKEQGARIDTWGVGTKLITSADMPALGGVYKLAAVYENGKEIPKIKLSDTTEKITNPGVKEVLRIYDAATDKAIADYIVRAGERVDTSKPLTIFHPVDTWKRMTIENFRVRDLREDLFRGGKRVAPERTLAEIAAYRKSEMSRFWEEYLRQDMPHIYKVDLSDALYGLKQELVEEYRGQ
ncbi:MAG TPA: nicotinate phosphoribosyltransferase [Firmicutes bacterium]|nr:nicotinate phosphoribosyltransferase [Bacillota bacterium]